MPLSPVTPSHLRRRVQQWPVRHLWRLSLALLATVLAQEAAWARWTAANDEANRQRLMAQSRAADARRAAAADNRSFAEGLARQRAAASPSAANSSNSARGSTGGASRLGMGAPALSADSDGERPRGMTLAEIEAVRARAEQAQEQPAARRARLTKAADSGQATAALELAYDAYLADKVHRDDATARRWFRKAAESGLPAAQGMLGLMLMHGQGGPVDVPEAERWLRQGADAGDAQAAGQWVLHRLTTDGLRADPRPLRSYLELSTAGHDMVGLAVYGTLLADEDDRIPDDLPRAERFLRHAVEQGELLLAPGRLGDLLLQRGRTPQLLAEAAKWFEVAAHHGDASAQYSLAMMKINGQGVAKDSAAALSLMKSAAESGLSQAQFVLGAMYNQGEGTPPDRALALQWWRKAAAAGHAQAREFLQRP